MSHLTAGKSYLESVICDCQFDFDGSKSRLVGDQRPRFRFRIQFGSRHWCCHGTR